MNKCVSQRNKHWLKICPLKKARPDQIGRISYSQKDHVPKSCFHKGDAHALTKANELLRPLKLNADQLAVAAVAKEECERMKNSGGQSQGVFQLPPTPEPTRDPTPEPTPEPS